MIYEVRVKPNSKKGPLVVVDGDSLTVYLREKPIDGEANIALIRLLAKHFDIPKTSILIKTGKHSRTKLVEIPENIV